jgi:hypothetical protein
MGDLAAVGIAMVQQEFSRTQPPGIQVREVSPGPLMGSGIGALVWHKNMADVKPHACRANHCEHEPKFWIFQQKVVPAFQGPDG